MRKRSLVIRSAIGFLLVFLSWMFLAWWMAERLIVEKPLDKADAIMVLGGAGTFVERTQQAAELFKKGTSSKVLLTNDGEFSGWSQLEQRNIPFAELAKRELIAQGVSPDSIEVLPGKVDGTVYEAELLQGIIKERGYRSVLLVTSAYHSRRAFWTFERVLAQNKVNIELGVKPAPPDQQTPPAFIWWLSLDGWDYVAGEYVKSIYYWLFT